MRLLIQHITLTLLMLSTLPVAHAQDLVILPGTKKYRISPSVKTVSCAGQREEAIKNCSFSFSNYTNPKTVVVMNGLGHHVSPLFSDAAEATKALIYLRTIGICN